MLGTEQGLIATHSSSCNRGWISKWSCHFRLPVFGCLAQESSIQNSDPKMLSQIEIPLLVSMRHIQDKLAMAVRPGWNEHHAGLLTAATISHCQSGISADSCNTHCCFYWGRCWHRCLPSWGEKRHADFGVGNIPITESIPAFEGWICGNLTCLVWTLFGSESRFTGSSSETARTCLLFSYVCILIISWCLSPGLCLLSCTHLLS